jgi:hypothetical protein
MNVRGMSRAASMRRRDVSTFEVAVRLRPEGKEVPYGRLSESELQRLWQCIALVSHGTADSAWRKDALMRIHPCNPRGRLEAAAQDNCFFGPPKMMDLVLQALGDDTLAGRKRMVQERWRIPPWHPEKLIAVAAHVAGHPTGTACHLDSLRYAFGYGFRMGAAQRARRSER